MSYHPCVSGCGRSLAPQDGHDHCLTCLGIQHAEEAFVDGSCSSCGDMTISELRNRLRCVKHGGVPLPLPRSGVRPGTKRGGTASGGVRGDLRITVRASPSGGSHPSGTPQPAGVPLVRTGASAEWGTPPVSFGASPDDQMSVAASEGEPSLSGDDDSAALPPSGVVALSEPDPEMTAMLSRAAENVGLVWNPPPRPDPSRLDEWFLGGGRAGFQRPPPVPFFPEVHEELTRSWKAPFTARNKPCGSSPLTTLDGGAALGYTGIPSVERSVAMQLCPTVHLPGSDYTGLPQDLQAVVRSLVPSGRSAPGAGIQACCGIHRCLIHRLGSHVQRARSIRGLDGSPTALAYQLPRVASSTPCPEPSQRAPSAQGRSGPYGQHCDRCVYQPARRFALPSHVATRPPPPPLESEASEVPSCHPHPRSVQSGSRRAVPSSTSRRVETPSPGGSADLGTVRSCPGRPVCISRNHPLPRVLLPNRGNARHGCTGTQLAPGPAQICVPPSEPTSTDTVQDQGGRGAGLVSGSILAQQDLVPGTHAPRDSPSLANSSEEGSAFSETGHPMAPAPGPVETPRMVPGWDAEVLADLPQEVALTITSARAPSTRRAYTLKWNLFVEWCSSHQEDPRRCSIRAVLSFLQQGLERRLSPSTLKVYVAAISAYHDPVEGKSVGKHNLVVRFLRGARRLNPPRPPSLPSWDLALVLRALITAPFEPLQSVELKFLSMKTILLTALASIKRVGDLQAFSVDDSCLQFGPADSSATLRPRPGYVPKVPTTPFRDQVVNLQALPPEEADPALALLCPVRALRQYTDRTQSFRTSEQLFVCYGGQQKGRAVSKQRMAHWIVDAITLAYEAQGVPCPLRLRAHSTRGVASSWVLARGASLADICRAAGWATPNTFARFYSLRVEPVSSCVLTSNG